MASVAKLHRIPSPYWPVATATFLLGLWYASPSVLKSGMGGLVMSAILASIFLPPAFGLMALLAITPFQPFLDFYLPSLGTLYAGSVLRDALLVVVSLQWLLRRLFTSQEKRPWSTAEKLALVYLAMLAIWIPAAPSFAGGLFGYRNLAGFIFLMFAASEIKTQTWRLVVIKLFLGIALCSAVLGIVEAVTYRAAFDWIGYDISVAVGPELPASYGFLARASGGTGNPLEFGFYMAIAATISAAFLAGREPIARWFLWLVLPLCSVAAVLTLARSGILAMGIGVLGTGLILQPRRLWLWVCLLIVVTILAAQSPAGEILADRLLFNDEPGVQTVNDRFDIWQQILVTPAALLGSGMGTQGAAVGRSGVTSKLVITDNYYGSILLQVGVIPLAFYLLMLAYLAKLFWRRLRDRDYERNRSLNAAMLVIIVMMVTGASLSSALESRTISVVLWTMFGIAIGMANNQSETSPLTSQFVPAHQ
jgi:O-antigen ligase/polysaccharide polymerase Wzy-like membrane protein